MALVQKSFSDIITFSRSSNATRVGPTGLVEYAPHNLFQRSQEFDNAYWAKIQSSITANAATSPDGTVTADVLVENTSNAIHEIQSATFVAGTYTASIYAKASTRFKMEIATAPVDVGFDLSNGTVLYGTGALITSVGNGWYRCSVTFTQSSSNVILFRVLDNAGNRTYTGDGTSGIYLWGAQLAVGPYALDYTPTTSAAVYGPRFDYDPVTLAARGLLVEEQRTNLHSYSVYPSGGTGWTTEFGTSTANTVSAPDGTTTATSLVENGSNNFHISYPTGVSGVVSSMTGSVFLKQGTRQYAALQLYIDNATKRYTVIVDLSNGTVTTTTNVGSPAGTSYSVSSFGNGWYRVSVTATSSSTSNAGIAIGLSDSANPGSYTAALPVYTGNGSGSIYYWGAQLESGAFSTSYIPTLASTVTRSADVASVNTLSPWWNASAATFYIENTFGGFGGQPIALADQAAVGNAWIYGGSAGAIQSYIVGPSLNINSGVTVSANATVKSAFTYGASGKAISVNGSTPVVSGNTVAPTASTELSLGNWGGSYYINGHIRRVAYYPRSLSSAELQALTA